MTKALIKTRAAAEDEKDIRHESRVIASGGLFYPLAEEALKLLTAVSIKPLKPITSKSPVIRRIQFHQAFQNLMQQLSVQLWKHIYYIIEEQLHPSRSCSHQLYLLVSCWSLAQGYSTPKSLPGHVQGQVQNSSKDLAGIPIITPHPSALRCVCGHTMDQFGDNILSCGNGPLCTEHYDSLRDITGKVS